MGTVLLFGRLADIAGWRRRELAVMPPRLSALRALLAGEDAALAQALAAPSVRAAVDKALALDDVDLGPHAEVAFMPAMSGG